MLYNNFDDLLFDMYLSKIDDIIRTDKPQHLLLGWASDNRTWYISLSSIKKQFLKITLSQNKCDELIIKLISRTIDINTFLTEYYPYFIEKRPELPKYMKLRAFL